MQTRRMLSVVAAALVAAALTAPGARADGFKVVVHPDNPLESLSRDDLKAVFLKTRSKIDGRKVVPVDQSASSEVRRVFTKMIHDWTMDAVMAYWQQQIFSGRGVPPPVKDGDQAVIDFVQANPEAIGYVDTLTDVGNLTVVRVE